MGFLGLAVLFLAASLIICLIHVIPRLSSGKSGGEPNTRSLRGITGYENWEAYHDAFKLTTCNSILKDTIRQIYGMAHNNVRSVRIVTKGVCLTFCGVLMIVAAIYASALAARGHHAFGIWQTETNWITSNSNEMPASAAANTIIPRNNTNSVSMISLPASLIIPTNLNKNIK
jgi:hypothetical protein